MTSFSISDEQIAAMSPDERRELIERLERPRDGLLDSRTVERLRHARIGVMTLGTLALIPWIVYLAFTLPSAYVAQNWPATWVGFDLLLVTLMAATAVLAWLRRQLVFLAGFTTGVLLICDAWFDIMTSSPNERWISILTAVFAELPLAAVLISRTLFILRLTATRLWLIEPGMPLWRIPLP